MHSSGIYYHVQKGDTLYQISKKYDVEIQILKRVNELNESSDLKVGSLIYVPTKNKILPSQNGNYAKYSRYETKPISNNISFKNNAFVWPIKGRIITRFGKGEKHRYDGINIEGEWGREVKAVNAGKVVYSGGGVRGYGNMIIIKHENKIYSIYALNSENLVSKGDYVKQSQVVAKVGGIPRIGKSFLHFQIRNGKRAIDPLLVLK